MKGRWSTSIGAEMPPARTGRTRRLSLVASNFSSPACQTGVDCSLSRCCGSAAFIDVHHAQASGQMPVSHCFLRELLGGTEPLEDMMADMMYAVSLRVISYSSCLPAHFQLIPFGAPRRADPRVGGRPISRQAVCTSSQPASPAGYAGLCVHCRCTVFPRLVVDYVSRSTTCW